MLLKLLKQTKKPTTTKTKQKTTPNTQHRTLSTFSFFAFSS